MLMKPEHRFFIAIVLGSVAVLALLAHILLPVFIDSDALKSAIEKALLGGTAGQVSYRNLTVGLLPYPNLSVTRARISIPGEAEGSIQKVTVAPRILPLLSGKIQIRSLSLDRPVFRVHLPEEDEEPLTRDALERKLRNVLGLLSARVPRASLSISGGDIELYRTKKRLVALRDMDADLRLPPEYLTIRLSCKPEPSGQVVLDLRLNAQDLSAEGHLSATDIPYHDMLKDHLPSGRWKIGRATGDVEVKFSSKGMQAVTAVITAKNPHLDLTGGEEGVTIRGIILRSAVHVSGDDVSVTVDELDLQEPSLRVAGRLISDAQGSRLELNGADVDVQAVRTAALSLAADVPATQNIFRILRGGQVPRISFKTDGPSISALGATENIWIEGSLRNGKISVPDAKLDMDEVNGEALISGGILKGTKLRARLGTALGSDGTLRLGLKGEDAPFHLDIRVETGMTELHARLMQFARDPAFRQELTLIRPLSGKVRGRLILGDSLLTMEPVVHAEAFDVAAAYDRVPYALAAQGDTVSYTGKSLTVGNVKASIGKSSFSGVSATFGLSGKKAFSLSTGPSSVSCSEIFRWISAEWAKDLPVKNLTGRIRIDEGHVEGEIDTPGKWRYDLKGTAEEVTVDAEDLPSALTLVSGAFHADNASLRFTDAAIRSDDSSLKLTGLFNGYRDGLQGVDIKTEGTLGEESTAWIEKTIGMPAAFRLHGPLTFTPSRIAWERDESAVFDGSFVVRGGPQVRLDVAWQPERLAVKTLAIRDGQSDARLSVDHSGDSLNFSFAGLLTGKTVDALLQENPYLTGKIKGDLKTRIPWGDYQSASVTGKIEGDGIVLPAGKDIRTSIDSIAAEGSGGSISVSSARITVNEKPVSLSGSISASERGFVTDLDVSTPAINWKEVQHLFSAERNQVNASGDKRTKIPPVLGTVRFSTGRATFGWLDVAPLKASVFMDEEHTRIRTAEAVVCGLSVTGGADVGSSGISFDAVIDAKGADLHRTVTCLSREKSDMIGTFDLSARLKGSGKADELARSLRGDLIFETNRGRIIASQVLSRVLALLSVTEVFRGRIPGLGGNGLEYNSFTIRGNIGDGNLIITEGIMDGKTLDIVGTGTVGLVEGDLDILILAAPLKTVNAVIDKIPIIRELLGGTVLSVPIKVTGSYGDPQTALAHPTAATGLAGLLIKTVTLPVKILDLLTPDRKSP